MLRIGMVAGEASGDILGAELIKGIKKRRSDIEITGIGGKLMQIEGCNCIYSTDELSVMGITEILPSLGRLIKIRKNIVKYFLDNPPDVFIGIDAPDFNFRIEKILRSNSIKTIHYVSPSVWAWREYRLKSIANAVDLMLVLFPFEENYYKKNLVNARFVGHPLADKLSDQVSRESACDELYLDKSKKIIALFPGSRTSELEKLVRIFAETAKICHDKNNDILFICNLVNDEHLDYVQQGILSIAPEVNISFYTSKSHTVMAAANVILLASGTATLEAMLVNRPMVVAYKVNFLTYLVAKFLIKLPYVSLPNILANQFIIPEYLQGDCTPENLSREIFKWLDDKRAVKDLQDKFQQLHDDLLSPVPDMAAEAVMQLINAG